MRRTLISISLANLCFLYLWARLLTLSSRTFSYYRTTPPEWSLLAALVLDVALISSLNYLALTVADGRRKSARVAATTWLVCVSLIAANSLRQLVADLAAQPDRSRYIGYSAALVGVGSLLWLGHARRGRELWSGVLLWLSPLPVLLLANAVWLDSTSELWRVGRGSAAGMLPAAAVKKSRVIWIIFDEMDQQIAFDARPQRVQMPEFDRLRRECFYATEARSPAPETLRSIPSLLTGRKVADIRRKTSDLQLRFAGTHDWVSWSRYPNLFRRVRALGFDTGLSGWHHPYCRVLGGDLSDCAWDGSGGYTGLETEDYVSGRSVAGKAYYLADWQLRTLPGLVRLHLLSAEPEEAAVRRQPHIDQFQFIRANALRMLDMSSMELLFIHLPVPHMPGIWNQNTKSFSLDGRSNYLDNLELADDTLGEIRRRLEQLGVWDESTVVISADHPLRTKFWRPSLDWGRELELKASEGSNVRVPFLIKLPKQTTGFNYDRAFNTVLTQDLLWEILNERMGTPQAAASWLDQRASESLIQPEPLPPVGRTGIP